jgi:hypothetical protein
MATDNFAYLLDDNGEDFHTHILPWMASPPPCFSYSQWVEWGFRHWVATGKPDSVAFNASAEECYCEDCTPAYRKIRCAEEACSHPAAAEVWRWSRYPGMPRFREHGFTGEFSVFMARPSHSLRTEANLAGLDVVKLAIDAWHRA